MQQKSIISFVLLSSILLLGVLTISISAKQVYEQTILSYAQVSNTTGLSKIHGVKILSPTRGQQVPAGKNLTVIGTSIANATSKCQVDIILNGIKPYQKATATGPGGANDYLLWSFLLTPKYAPIKVGLNQLKARFFCTDNPTLVSYYSANITGVATSTVNQLQKR